MKRPLHHPNISFKLDLMRSWLFMALLGGVAVGLLLWPDSVDEETPKRGRHRAG